jgi:hypothetical protein
MLTAITPLAWISLSDSVATNYAMIADAGSRVSTAVGDARGCLVGFPCV